LITEDFFLFEVKRKTVGLVIALILQTP